MRSHCIPRLLPSFLCAVVWLASAAPVLAQSTSTADRAAADVLFDQARKLMAEGRHAEACPKLAAAQKLRPGIGTLLNLGACYEKLGRTASAWASFRDAAAGAARSGDERQAIAEENERRLAPTLTRMSIVVAARPEGLVVTRDGAAVDPELWGTPLPIDPGTYVVEAHAPRHVAWSTTVEARGTGSTVTVTVPALGMAPGAIPGPAAEPVPTAVVRSPSVVSDAPAPSSTQRTVGIYLVAAGAVGAAAGAVFGFMSMSAHDSANKTCTLGPNHDQCDAGGYDASRRALDFGNASTIAFIVGGAAAAAGATLWLTAPSRAAQSAVGVGIGPGRVDVMATF